MTTTTTDAPARRPTRSPIAGAYNRADITDTRRAAMKVIIETQEPRFLWKDRQGWRFTAAPPPRGVSYVRLDPPSRPHPHP